MNQKEQAAPLPFFIVPAVSPEEMNQVCTLRADAYARHNYEARHVANLRRFDASDADATHLIAVDKSSGQLVGAIRLRSSRDNHIRHHPGLVLTALNNEDYAYADRFGVDAGVHAELIAQGLMKSLYLWAVSKNLPWIATCALPGMVRRYRRVGLRVLAGAGAGFTVPTQHASPYYALGGRIADGAAFKALVASDVRAFVFDVNHPEITIFQQPGFQ